MSIFDEPTVVMSLDEPTVVMSLDEIQTLAESCVDNSDLTVIEGILIVEDDMIVGLGDA